jgi:hypothetical protein
MDGRREKVMGNKIRSCLFCGETTVVLKNVCPVCCATRSDVQVETAWDMFRRLKDVIGFFKKLNKYTCLECRIDLKNECLHEDMAACFLYEYSEKDAITIMTQIEKEL